MELQNSVGVLGRNGKMTVTMDFWDCDVTIRDQSDSQLWHDRSPQSDTVDELAMAHFTQGQNVEIFGQRAKAANATLHYVFKWEWTRFLKSCKKIRNGCTELKFFFRQDTNIINLV